MHVGPRAKPAQSGVGVLRHHMARKDGTVRDSVMFSILATEWRDVKRHLLLRMARRGGVAAE